LVFGSETEAPVLLAGFGTDRLRSAPGARFLGVEQILLNQEKTQLQRLDFFLLRSPPWLSGNHGSL
jgi:hypothetical protein